MFTSHQKPWSPSLPVVTGSWISQQFPLWCSVWQSKKKKKEDEALVSSSNRCLCQQPGIWVRMCSCLCKSHLDVNWTCKENTSKQLKRHILKAFSITHTNPLCALVLCWGRNTRHRGCQEWFWPRTRSHCLAPSVAALCSFTSQHGAAMSSLRGMGKCLSNSSRWHNTLTNLAVNTLGAQWEPYSLLAFPENGFSCWIAITCSNSTVRMELLLKAR